MDQVNFLPPLKFNNPKILNTGLIIGLITIVSSLLTAIYFKPTDNKMLSGIISIGSTVISAYLLFNAIKRYRDEDLSGYIPFGRAMLFSILVGVIVGIISAVFMYILYTFISPDLITDMTNLQMAEMEKQGLSQEQMDAASKMMGFMKNPGFLAFSGFFAMIIMYAILGVVIGLILKRWPRPYTEAVTYDTAAQKDDFR